MAVIKFNVKGNFNNLDSFLKRAKTLRYRGILEEYGQRGVQALRNATPVDTGLTSDSWDYTIFESSRGLRLVWSNSNIVDGVKIAIVLQYGHATRGGTWVEGTDYINPALQPIFDALSAELWKEVTG